MKIDWEKLMRVVLEIAEDATNKTESKIDDIAFQVVKAALERVLPSYTSAGPEEVSAFDSLPADLQSRVATAVDDCCQSPTE